MVMLRGKAALIRNMKVRPIGEGQQCGYSHRTCTQNRIDGYEFCIKHILEDKASPFKQCSYIAPKTNRRCTNAAPKSDRKDGYCMEHAKKVAMTRQRTSRKRRPPETAETLLEELSGSNTVGGDAAADGKRLRLLYDGVASRALEYASSSDSDTEAPLVDQAWQHDNDSDAESIDSDQEDPLKHASVYSQEEVALLLRDKLIRLQSLYIEQFKRLQHVLKEKRRKFLQAYKQEHEMLEDEVHQQLKVFLAFGKGSIRVYKNDSNQYKKYAKLRAMQRYHKFYGKESLLHQKCNLRRIAVAEGINYRPPTFTRCIGATNDGRCNKRVVPLSKYCLKHILNDAHQVLFRPCSFHGNACSEPVFSLDDIPLCLRHAASSSDQANSARATQTETKISEAEGGRSMKTSRREGAVSWTRYDDGSGSMLRPANSRGCEDTRFTCVDGATYANSLEVLSAPTDFGNNGTSLLSAEYNLDTNMDTEDDLLNILDGGFLGTDMTEADL